MTDFALRNEGSIYILTPLSDAANTWCDDNLPDDATRWNTGYVIEPRYVEPIVTGIINDGLEFEGKYT